jgi:hypothetical protein
LNFIAPALMAGMLIFTNKNYTTETGSGSWQLLILLYDFNGAYTIVVHRMLRVSWQAICVNELNIAVHNSVKSKKKASPAFVYSGTTSAGLFVWPPPISPPIEGGFVLSSVFWVLCIPRCLYASSTAIQRSLR